MNIKTIAKKLSRAANKFSDTIQVEVTIINTDDDDSVKRVKRSVISDKSQEIRKTFSTDK